MILSIKSPAQKGLSQLVEFVRKVVAARLRTYVSEGHFEIDEAVAWSGSAQPFWSALHQLTGLTSNIQEQVLLGVSLMPHLQPSFFESIILAQFPGGGDFPEFGGIKSSNSRSMLPTGETIQFMLAGTNVEERLKVQDYFAEEHYFFKEGILWLEPVREGEPKMSGRIIVANEWIDRLLKNRETMPRFGLDFPAKRIATDMNWTDLVLPNKTLLQVQDITTWVNHHRQLFDDENLGRKMKRGYRVLFHGPSGTGKTLTATLLGKQFNMDVYRVDLSQVVSKYIGETEQNLEKIFRRAENKNWILFFDEADALFGSRTNVQSSHDKYANQEVSYLLQRVEDFNGMLILASNFKSNLDDAFIRRFQSVVHFPMPNASERFALWKNSLPHKLVAPSDTTLSELCAKYEMSGAAILNAVQFASLQAIARNDKNLSATDLMDGIRKEFMKEEKSV